MAKPAHQPLHVPFTSADDPAAPSSLRVFIKLRLISRKLRAFAGMAGLGIAGYVAWQKGGSTQEIFTHAFLGGLAAYLITWWMTLLVAGSVRNDLSRDLTAVMASTAEERPGE